MHFSPGGQQLQSEEHRGGVVGLLPNPCGAQVQRLAGHDHRGGADQGVAEVGPPKEPPEVRSKKRAKKRMKNLGQTHPAHNLWFKKN